MWHRRLARKQAHPPIHRTEHRREIMSDPNEGTLRCVENFARKKNGLKSLASAGYQAIFNPLTIPVIRSLLEMSHFGIEM